MFDCLQCVVLILVAVFLLVTAVRIIRRNKSEGKPWAQQDKVFARENEKRFWDFILKCVVPKSVEPRALPIKKTLSPEMKVAAAVTAGIVLERSKPKK